MSKPHSRYFSVFLGQLGLVYFAQPKRSSLGVHIAHHCWIVRLSGEGGFLHHFVQSDRRWLWLVAGGTGGGR